LSGYYETIPLDDTDVFKWTRQDYRPYTEDAAGDIEVAGWDVYGVVVAGEYSLATLAETRASLTQLAELVENQAKTFGLWGDIWHPFAFIRHSVVGTFWVTPDTRPSIRLYGDGNRAYVEFFMRYVGDAVSHVACYLVEDVEILSSDWSI